MNNKKKFIIFSSAIIIILIAFIIYKLSFKKDILGNLEQSPIVINEVNVEFMSAEEKSLMNLPAESKIQVLKKDESGNTEVYRIIRKDEDIVLDPSRIGDPDMIRPAQPIAN